MFRTEMKIMKATLSVVSKPEKVLFVQYLPNAKQKELYVSAHTEKRQAKYEQETIKFLNEEEYLDAIAFLKLFCHQEYDVDHKMWYYDV